MKALAPTAGVLLGLTLLGFGFVLPLFLSGESSWTEAKSERMSDLVGNRHGLIIRLKQAEADSSPHRGPNPAELKQELEAVNKELETLRLECDAIREQPTQAARLLKWVGGIVTTIGIVCCLAVRGS